MFYSFVSYREGCLRYLTSLRLAQVVLIILILDTSYNDVEYVVLFFIYVDIVGKHERSATLTDSTQAWNAVCCNADYTFVADYRDGNVLVHTWTGLYIQKLSVQGNHISTIQCSHDGTVLQLVTGDTRATTRLHAYKVSFISMTFCTTHIQICGIIEYSASSGSLVQLGKV